MGGPGAHLEQQREQLSAVAGQRRRPRRQRRRGSRSAVPCAKVAARARRRSRSWRHTHGSRAPARGLRTGAGAVVPPPPRHVSETASVRRTTPKKHSADDARAYFFHGRCARADVSRRAHSFRSRRIQRTQAWAELCVPCRHDADAHRVAAGRCAPLRWHDAPQLRLGCSGSAKCGGWVGVLHQRRDAAAADPPAPWCAGRGQPPGRGRGCFCRAG